MSLPAAVYTVRASGGVVFHRPLWYACASRPTQTHLMAGWLAFLPLSVIMALLQASLLCSLYTAIFLKGWGLPRTFHLASWSGSNFNNNTSPGEDVHGQQKQATVACSGKNISFNYTWCHVSWIRVNHNVLQLAVNLKTIINTELKWREYFAFNPASYGVCEVLTLKSCERV